MNRAIVVVVALAATVAIGVSGYVAGQKTATLDETVIAAAVESYIESRPEMLPAQAPSAPGSGLDETQVAAVETIIQKHLISNPEIIRDAINELQRKEFEADLAAQKTAISDDADLIFASSRQAVLGNPEGEVTLVEFFDYNCGYCKRAHADMKRLLEDDPKLRVVLKEFPVLGDGSVEAAHVSAAVNIAHPEKFSDFHDALLLGPGRINGDRALAVAEEMGLEMDKIRELVPSEEVKATIDEVYALAEKLSLTGTPSYVTAKEVVIGAVGYDALKSKIDEARACEASASC